MGGDKNIIIDFYWPKVDEAVTFLTCLWHALLHKLCCCFFCFDQIRSLITRKTFIIVVVILGQKSGERLKDHLFSFFFLLLSFIYSLFSFCSSGVITDKIISTERLTLVTSISTTWGTTGDRRAPLRQQFIQRSQYI